jgi:hypothetical protein
MATVHNFNGDQNHQHDNTSQRFAKTKELQSHRTSQHTIAAHLFLPRRPMPAHHPKEPKAMKASQN